MFPSTSLPRLQQDSPTGLGWLLGAAAASLAWLIPTHHAPWTPFYNEIALALALWPVGLWVLWAGRRRRWPLPEAAGGLLLVGLLPLAQAALGLLLVPAEAIYPALYVLGLLFTLSAAQQAEQLVPSRLADLVFASLALAALVSTGIALAQWAQLGDGGGFLALPYENRAIANLGQPNNLATLLVWGVVALGWAHWRRAIGGGVALGAAAFLLVGVALTGSRTGALEVLLLALAAWRWRRLLGGTRWAWAAGGLVLWLGLVLLAAPTLTDLMGLGSVRQLNESVSPRQRTALLHMVLAAIAERPWQGWGWNQLATAHVALADRFPLHGTVGNAHNLVLDLVVWFGLPLGGLIAVALGRWIWRIDRRIDRAEDAWLHTAVAVFLLHAMLELPHMLAYFLLPVAVWLGTLAARQPEREKRTVPWTAAAGMALALGTALVMMLVEYPRVEANALAARVRAAQIAGAREEYDPGVLLLQPLQKTLVTLRTEPRRGMSDEELDRFKSAVRRHPGNSGLLRYAQAAALNQRPDDARWALGVACSLHRLSLARAAARQWTLLAETQYPEMANIAFPCIQNQP